VIRLELLGTRLTVRTTQYALEHEIKRLWAAMFVERAYPPGGPVPVPVVFDSATVPSRLFFDGELASTAADDADLLVAFATLANRRALEGCLDFAVHAAVLSTGSGVVAMPASSGVGKSTLTAACLRRGLSYVSDEALCVSYDDALVTPYPRPLALSRWSAQSVGLAVRATALHEMLADPRDLDGRVEAQRLPLQQLVLLERDRESASPVLAAVHRADAAAAMLHLSFNHFRRPRDAFMLVGRLLLSVQAWHLRYSDASAAADLIADRWGGAA
jgi:hypothetical protein